jgi:hypothetical protein|tara:strand:+ start:9032 stop:9226 length:195 start_codon:yes stop_codon:yes gene_type:complete
MAAEKKAAPKKKPLPPGRRWPLVATVTIQTYPAAGKSVLGALDRKLAEITAEVQDTSVEISLAE